MGIGGTGVVTTSQLLATAAVLSGRHVRTLDRTGLAQKGGAVVSDLIIEPTPFELGNSIGDGACDLYLGYDLLVAADSHNAVSLAPNATAIVSTSVVPTGAMVSDVNVTFPEVGATLERVTDRLVDGNCVSFHLRHYAEGLFGSEQMGNMFMLGVAVQLGALSLLPDAVEEAIVLNGVAVKQNLQAFRRGRQFIADKKALDASLKELKGEQIEKQLLPSAIVNAASGSELERVVALRRADLVAYQNEACAHRYELFVEEVRAAEAAQAAASSLLSETVAKYLYKLMAYKDEYEVAGLHLTP